MPGVAFVFHILSACIKHIREKNGTVTHEDIIHAKEKKIKQEI